MEFSKKAARCRQERARPVGQGLPARASWLAGLHAGPWCQPEWCQWFLRAAAMGSCTSKCRGSPPRESPSPPSGGPLLESPAASAGAAAGRSRAKAPVARKAGATLGGSVSKHVETAAKTGALNLSNSGLKKLPARVLQLAKLRTLNLSNNALVEIPGACVRACAASQPGLVN
jgi:hypothetical protein